MSAFYGTPEGDEIPSLKIELKPQARVEPVDDPSLVWAMHATERDFVRTEPKKMDFGLLDPELRKW